LFGGGIAIANGFSDSGLAVWLGGHFNLLKDIEILIVLVAIIASVNFLTEITSNLATTSVVLPILIPLSLVINVHPYILMIGATIAAYCAFMLPAATPPNAIVFGSGLVTIKDMMRIGLWLNIISILLLSILAYFLVPFVFDLSIIKTV
jgi:sodium-dependent dicarboxylate transporter 2/3/5